MTVQHEGFVQGRLQLRNMHGVLLRELPVQTELDVHKLRAGRYAISIIWEGERASRFFQVAP